MRHFTDALFEENLHNSKIEQTEAALNISELCKFVDRRLSTFGGNCGSFALALCTILTKLGHKVDLVICSNWDDFKESDSDYTDEDELDWYLDGEPDIYHVAIRLDKDNNQLYDGEGIKTIDDLYDFCYEYYDNSTATIACWTVESRQDYELFYKIFRYNTNMSVHPSKFEAVIDKYLNTINK